jgi:hypothetical protein
MPSRNGQLFRHLLIIIFVSLNLFVTSAQLACHLLQGAENKHNCKVKVKDGSNKADRSLLYSDIEGVRRCVIDQLLRFEGSELSSL